MTSEEYLALGETTENYELVDGVVCMSPKPSRRHQRVLCLLQMQYEAFAREHSGFEYFPDVDVCFDSGHVYAPDMCCFRPGRLPPLDAVLDVAPNLVIEILSPSSKAFDLTRKKADYARFGVREYWVLDPRSGSLRCFRPRSGQLVEIAVSGDAFASEAIEGFVLDLKPFRGLAEQE